VTGVLAAVVAALSIGVAAPASAAPSAAHPVSHAVSKGQKAAKAAKPAKGKKAKKAKKALVTKKKARRVSKPTGATATAIPTPAATPSPAADSTPVALSAWESRLVVLVNQARAEQGIAAVTAVPGATDVARRWTVRLASDQRLSHNPELAAAMGRAGSGDWTWLAENVGMVGGGTADELFAAYMQSPPHRANILNPRATFIGMGVVESVGAGGRTTAWNTMDFTDAYASSYGAARTWVVSAVDGAGLRSLAGSWGVAL
jgi:uncharacterized protein YkwD